MQSQYERVIGTTVLVVGVGLLLFAFYQSYADLQHLPTNQAPDSSFTWSVTDYTVTAHDTATSSVGSITTVYWTFGDNNSSSSQSPSHTYTNAGSYNVTLMIQDSNGNSAQSSAEINVGTGATGSGGSSPSQSIGGGSGIGSVLSPIFGGISGLLKTSETFIFLIVEYLVGASILKAGWNLITPKAETIQVRVKPRSLQVEPVEPPAPPRPAASSLPTPPPAPSPGPGSGTPGSPPG
jgi:PKD repeat protein